MLTEDFAVAVVQRAVYGNHHRLAQGFFAAPGLGGYFELQPVFGYRAGEVEGLDVFIGLDIGYFDDGIGKGAVELGVAAQQFGFDILLQSD